VRRAEIDAQGSRGARVKGSKGLRRRGMMIRLNGSLALGDEPRRARRIED
jgi:hypothetical protein